MIRAEALPTHILRERRYQGILWVALAVAAYLLAYSLATADAGTDFGNWPRSWELPIQEPIDVFFEWVGDVFALFFNPISKVIDAGIAGIDTFLLWLPWVAVVAAVSMLGFRLGGRWLGLFCGVAALFIGLNGFWDSAMVTLSVVGVSVIIAVGLGVPIGIFVAFSNRFEAIARPVLDTMQVMPAFVYLIPALVLFGVSGTQGVFLTVIYSIPPVIRLTNLGITTGAPSRDRDGTLARIDDVPDAVSSAAAAGKRLDHDGRQPDHNDGSFHDYHHRARGSGRTRQGCMVLGKGGGRRGGS